MNTAFPKTTRVTAKTLGVIAFIIAKLASAQSSAPGNPVTRGGANKVNACGLNGYKTCAALALFVESAGSDSNTCLSAAEACLTVQGAVDKVPKLIRHPVSITLGTGNFTGATYSGFSFDPADTANGAYLTTQGSLTNATPATGTATGTATAGTAGSGTTYGTLTDSGQTWTVNNLKNYLIEITGGTGSGQIRVISSNTATAITIVGTWTAPVAASSTYAIRDWAGVINAAVNQSALPNSVAAAAPAGFVVVGNHPLRASSGSTNITFDKLKIAPGTAVNSGIIAAGLQYVGILNSYVLGKTLGSGISSTMGTSYRIQQSIVASETGNAISNSGNLNFVNTLGVTNSMAESGATSGAIVNVANNGISGSGWEINSTNNGAGQGLEAGQGVQINTQITGLRVNCTSGGSTVGVRVFSGDSTSGPVGGGASMINITSMVMTNCPVGVSVAGLSKVSLTSSVTLTGPGSGTALQVTRGGKIEVATSPTLGSYATEVNIDGDTYTLAEITALTPPVVMNLNYGSWIGR